METATAPLSLFGIETLRPGFSCENNPKNDFMARRTYGSHLMIRFYMSRIVVVNDTNGLQARPAMATDVLFCFIYQRCSKLAVGSNGGVS